MPIDAGAPAGDKSFRYLTARVGLKRFKCDLERLNSIRRQLRGMAWEIACCPSRRSEVVANELSLSLHDCSLEKLNLHFKNFIAQYMYQCI